MGQAWELAEFIGVREKTIVGHKITQDGCSLLPPKYSPVVDLPGLVCVYIYGLPTHTCICTYISGSPVHT